ncbi:hypothetical protein [Methylobacterium sp. A54F]
MSPRALPFVRPFALAAALPVLALCLVAGPAGAGPAAGDSVLACTELVDLRLLLASAHEDRAAAEGAVGTRPGCRLLPREAVGAVERRALIGGAPYECLSVQAAGRCLWVAP